MTDSSTHIRVRGFSRLAYLALLLVFSAAVGAYLWFTAGVPHGIGAAVMLGLGSLGLAAYAGPVERVREFHLDGQGVTILRFTRVRTRVEWHEISHARVVSDPPRVMITPHDAGDFFNRHRELDVSRSGPSAVIPVGRDRASADALVEAVAQHTGLATATR